MATGEQASDGAGLPDLSVIVAARNAAGTIERLLDRLAEQSLSRDRFEVLVVDDRSEDETAELAGRRPGVVVIRSERHGGAYRARNLGLARARGRVVAITDADCVPEPTWLERGLEQLERLGADLLGGRIEVNVSPRPTVAELVDLARFLDQRRSVEVLGFATAANVFVRRPVFERIGAFDSRLISGGDVEFSQRATGAGFALAYSDRPVVSHAPRQRPTELARKAYRVGFGHAQLTINGHPGYDERPLMWSRPGFYRPRRELLGRERVERAGHLPDPRLERRLELGQYLFLQLPMIAGSLAATIRERSR